MLGLNLWHGIVGWWYCDMRNGCMR